MTIDRSTVLTVVLALVRCVEDIWVRDRTHWRHTQFSHQIFRIHETYYLSVHGLLLFGLPALVVLFSFWLESTPVDLPSLGSKVFGGYLLTLLLSVVTYRVSPWHPLARFPGPFLRPISHFVSAIIYISGNRSRRFAVLHGKYGDVVRTGMYSIQSTC